MRMLQESNTTAANTKLETGQWQLSQVQNALDLTTKINGFTEGLKLVNTKLGTMDARIIALETGGPRSDKGKGKSKPTFHTMSPRGASDPWTQPGQDPWSQPRNAPNQEPATPQAEQQWNPFSRGGSWGGLAERILGTARP